MNRKAPAQQFSTLGEFYASLKRGPNASTPRETFDDLIRDPNAPVPETTTTEASVGDRLTPPLEASVDVGGSGCKISSVPTEKGSTATVTATSGYFQEGSRMGQAVSSMNPDSISQKFGSYMLLSQQASTSALLSESPNVWEFPAGGSHGVPNVDERSFKLKWFDL